jgi:hypothetical protein
VALSVVMPALEMAQETGKLVSWKKKNGENVKKGELLLEVETDKAVVEIEAAATASFPRSPRARAMSFRSARPSRGCLQQGSLSLPPSTNRRRPAGAWTRILVAPAFRLRMKLRRTAIALAAVVRRTIPSG